MSNFRAKYYSSLLLKGVSLVPEDLDTLLDPKKIELKKLRQKVKFIKGMEDSRLRIVFLLILEIDTVFKDTWNFCYHQRKDIFEDILASSKSYSILNFDELKLSNDVSTWKNDDKVLFVNCMLDKLNFSHPTRRESEAKRKCEENMKNVLDVYSVIEKGGIFKEDIEGKEDKKKKIENEKKKKVLRKEKKVLVHVRKNHVEYFRLMANVMLKLYDGDIYNSFWCLQKAIEYIGPFGIDDYINRCYWIVKRVENLLKKNDKKLYGHLVSFEKGIFEDGKINLMVSNWVGSLFSSFFNQTQILILWTCLFCMKHSCVEMVSFVVLSIFFEMELKKIKKEEDLFKVLKNENFEVDVNKVIRKAVKLFEIEKKNYHHFSMN